MLTSTKYILAIDQGTSSTKTLIFDGEGKQVAKGVEPLHTTYGADGFVEQDPETIYQNVLISVKKCLDGFKLNGGEIDAVAACGISNQRETFVVWDETGQPLHNAVVWQCKRSTHICKRMRAAGFEERITNTTGLIIDPYFSGTKLTWLYENVQKVRAAVDEGRAYFGTIDTWLLYKLTNGNSYLTDFTNASRTLFFNLRELSWDKSLLNLFGVQGINLPKPKPSSYHFGETTFDGLLDKPLPITAMIGDSHAAAFGEGCFTPGAAKATMGTGSSILMNVGSEVKLSQNGMMATICWSTEDRVDYALEGVIVSCGSTIEWLKNEVGLISESKATEAAANAVTGNNGVYLIPAFSGLGAPHWDMNRKASIVGLTFDCNKNHIIRAALESIPYQIKDVIDAMESDAGISLNKLMVDGGATSNAFIMQFLTDLLNRPVETISFPDVSALGAAYLAGLKAEVYSGIDQLQTLNKDKRVLRPKENAIVNEGYEGWKAAVANGTGAKHPAR
jgi:glycerol kinase